MTKIATVADLQKNTSPLTQYAAQQTVIITNRGKGQNVILPFFEGNQAALDRYYEDLEMAQNREMLEARYAASKDSGISDFTI